MPDLSLGRACGFDTLIARLAAITKAGGSDLLHDAIKASKAPAELITAAIEAPYTAPITAR